MSQREMLNIKQVQKILDISERTAFRLISSGELKGFKVGREWRFFQSDIDDYIERQRKKAENQLRGDKPLEDRPGPSLPASLVA